MSNEALKYLINDKEVLVKIIKTNNKNMYLKIIGEEIIVSAPKMTSKSTINKFVSQHIDKFYHQLLIIKANKKYDFHNKFVYLLGTKYNFEIFSGFKQRSFEIIDNVIYINLKNGTETETEKYIKDFLKKIVTEKMIEIQQFWEEQMNIPPHKISVVYKTSSWGSNLIGQRKISYSAKLAHYDEKILQYLAVHELAHYKEPNHSKRFWNLVKLYIPNYKNIQKILKLDPTLIEE